MTEQIRFLMFACACAAFMVLVLMGIAWHNNHIPWPEQDNPEVQGEWIP